METGADDSTAGAGRALDWTPGPGDSAPGNPGEQGNPSDEAMAAIARVESMLVRWEDGLALFRVRVERADGATAEAHGAAHDGEAEKFWTLAEDRAISRAVATLSRLPVLQPPVTQTAAGPTAQTAEARPSQGASFGLAPVSSGGAVRQNPPASNVTPAPRATPLPDRPPTVRASSAMPPPSNPPAASAPPPVPPAATPSASGAPLADELDDPFTPDRIPPAAPPNPDSTSGNGSGSVPHPRRSPIRSENGGAPPPGPPASTPPGGSLTPGPAHPRAMPPRSTPAPMPVRCAVPGCGLPLTGGQASLSTHRFGQPLCNHHFKERQASEG